MVELLSTLKTITEYNTMLQALSNHQNTALTGIGQINRSHMIAGLYTHTTSPIVVICQDDLAAKRLAEELKYFLNLSFPVLPSR